MRTFRGGAGYNVGITLTKAVDVITVLAVGRLFDAQGVFAVSNLLQGGVKQGENLLSAFNLSDHRLHAYGCVIAKSNSRIVGFLISRTRPHWNGGAQCHRIVSLNVLPEARRSGVASALVERALDRCTALLGEVRESNQAARRLFAKLGFFEYGRAPGFYRNPCEDAILIRKNR